MAGELFLVLLILKVTQCSVYVMGGDGFGTIVASFGDAVSRFGPWIFQVDGFVVVASPANACRILQPAPNDSLPLYSNIYDSLNNTTTSLDFAFIALIKRGDCEDDLKVLNAQQAGFNGAIVYNSDNMTISPMHGHTWINEIEIPSVLVDNSAGERLKLYNWTRPEKFVITMVNFFNIPLKYVLLSLILLVAASFLLLTGCFSIHICNLWRRARRGRLSRRHLRRLLVKRYNKGQDPYETCPICLEDYEERQKVRLLLCRHAFHTECVDPWLLHNHRRCPVCNRIVDLSKSSLPPAGTRLRVFWARLSQRFLPTSWQERPVTTPTSDSAALFQNFRDDDDTVPLLQPNCEESSPLFRPVDVAVITSAHSETADETLINPTSGITIKFSDGPVSGTKSWTPLPDDGAHVINSDFDDQLLSLVDPPSHLEAN